MAGGGRDARPRPGQPVTQECRLPRPVVRRCRLVDRGDPTGGVDEEDIRLNGVPDEHDEIAALRTGTVGGDRLRVREPWPGCRVRRSAARRPRDRPRRRRRPARLARWPRAARRVARSSAQRFTAIFHFPTPVAGPNTVQIAPSQLLTTKTSTCSARRATATSDAPNRREPLRRDPSSWEAPRAVVAHRRPRDRTRVVDDEEVLVLVVAHCDSERCARGSQAGLGERHRARRWPNPVDLEERGDGAVGKVFDRVGEVHPASATPRMGVDRALISEPGRRRREPPVRGSTMLCQVVVDGLVPVAVRVHTDRKTGKVDRRQWRKVRDPEAFHAQQ